jgi:hypothetical protein
MDLRQLFEQDLLFGFGLLLERHDLQLEADHTDFVYVDGEEGDFGIIRYKDATGQVVAIKNIHGGDSEDLELTDYGRPLVAKLILGLFKQTLAEKLQVPLESL